MEQSKLRRLLQSVGMEVFIYHYHDFTTEASDTLTGRMLKENPRATSPGAQRTRIANAKKILQSGKKTRIEALRAVAAARVSEPVAQEAERLIREESEGRNDQK